MVSPDLGLQRTDSSTASLVVVVSKVGKQKAKRRFEAKPACFSGYIFYVQNDARIRLRCEGAAKLHHISTTRWSS